MGYFMHTGDQWTLNLVYELMSQRCLPSLGVGEQSMRKRGKGSVDPHEDEEGKKRRRGFEKMKSQKFDFPKHFLASILLSFR